MSKANNKPTVLLRLDPEIYELLRLDAFTHHVSMSEIVRAELKERYKKGLNRE